MYNTYMFSVYVISLVIVGTWCSNNKEILATALSTKYLKKKGKPPTKLEMFLGIYTVPFIPVVNSFLVVLLTLELITKIMLKQK